MYLHQHEAVSSVMRIRDSGPASMLTALVIAIAIAMPTSLHLLLNNVEDLLNSWDQQNSLTVFIAPNLAEQDASQLEQQVASWPEVKHTRFISAAMALEDFRRNSGLSDIINQLNDNPLPAAIVLQSMSQDPERLQILKQRLENLDNVDSVVVDTAWIKRLNAMVRLGERFTIALSVALLISVLLIILNTIRLAIANRSDEIAITKLMGATDSFVRRPFLYTGAWFGFVGGFMSLILAEMLIILLQGPVIVLAALYESDYALQGVSIIELLLVPIAGLTIGLIGALLAVSSHLRSLLPE